MTKVALLEGLVDFTKDSISELILPVRMQKGDTEQQYRAADVYKMRLPDSQAATKKAPYIIHQIITGKDAQPEGEKTNSRTKIRSIFCVYCEDEQEGGLHLLNLMERLRIDLLKKRIISKQFELDLKDGLEYLIYPDDTAPYYAGEMISDWKLPSVEREVIL